MVCLYLINSNKVRLNLMRQPCSQEHIKFTSFGKKRFELLGCL